jgi:hypothetical protein
VLAGILSPVVLVLERSRKASAVDTLPPAIVVAEMPSVRDFICDGSVTVAAIYCRSISHRPEVQNIQAL